MIWTEILRPLPPGTSTTSFGRRRFRNAPRRRAASPPGWRARPSPGSASARRGSCSLLRTKAGGSCAAAPHRPDGNSGACPLQRTDLREPRFPETQDVLRNVQFGRNLRDGPERIGGLAAPFACSNAAVSACSSSMLCAQPLLAELLIRFFKTWLGRKTRTRRGRIGTSSPVFGLRPIRSPFWRTVKLPNEDIFTGSPRAMASEISFNMASTSSADSVPGKTNFLVDRFGELLPRDCSAHASPRLNVLLYQTTSTLAPLPSWRQSKTMIAG